MAYDSIQGTLSGLSKSKAREVIGLLCASHGLKAMPVQAPIGPIQAAVAKTPRSSRPPPRKTASPVTRAARSKINDLNKQIKEQSEKLGTPLAADHVLIQRRDQAFRDLKEVQNSQRA